MRSAGGQFQSSSLLEHYTDHVDRFYLVLICPSVVYIAAIYFLFPETVSFRENMCVW